MAFYAGEILRVGRTDEFRRRDGVDTPCPACDKLFTLGEETRIIKWQDDEGNWGSNGCWSYMHPDCAINHPMREKNIMLAKKTSLLRNSLFDREGTTDDILKAIQLGHVPGCTYDRNRHKSRRYTWKSTT